MLIEQSNADVNCVGFNRKSAIYYAAKLGNIEAVKLLASKGAAIDLGSSDINPISIASKNGHQEIVQYLITEKNITFKNGNASGDDKADEILRTTIRECLERTAENGHLDLVKNMVEDKILKLKDNDYYKPRMVTNALLRAARCGHQSIVEYLVNQGASSGATDHLGTIGKKDFKHYDSPLSMAAKCGHQGIVKYLLTQDKNIDSRLKALQNALRDKKLDIAQYIINNIELDFSNNELMRAFELAVRKGFLDIVNLLILKGIDVNAKSKARHQDSNILYTPSNKGYLDVIKVLVDAGAKIDSAVIQAAAENNHLDILKYFVEQGADLTKEKRTFLTATRKGHVQIINYFLQQGISPNTAIYNYHYYNYAYEYYVEYKWWQSALMEAARYGKLEVVKALVEAGADILQEYHPLTKNYTAVFSAAACSSDDKAKDILEYFASKGIDFANYGNALENAVRTEKVKTVKFLLTKGISPNTICSVYSGERKRKKSILMLAVATENLEMVQTLVEAGADMNYKDRYDQKASDYGRYSDKNDAIKRYLWDKAEELEKKTKGDDTPTKSTNIMLSYLSNSATCVYNNAIEPVYCFAKEVCDIILLILERAPGWILGKN